MKKSILAYCLIACWIAAVITPGYALAEYDYINITNPFTRKIPIAIPAFKAVSGTGTEMLPVRKKGFPDLLSRHLSDFYCFQEANAFQVNHLRSILPDYHVIGQRWPSPGFWQNNVIFYHNTWEPVFCDHFFLSHTPSIPSRFRNSKWPRQCTMGIFKKKDFQLICTTTHFDFNSQVQVMSAKLIVRRLALLPGELPAIVCGDFNADPSGPCYRIFTQNDPRPAEPAGGFINVFPEPFPGTHHGFTGATDGDHIDWILYRGNIAHKKACVIADQFDGIYPSDHFPLRAIFLYQNEASCEEGGKTGNCAEIDQQGTQGHKSAGPVKRSSSK